MKTPLYDFVCRYANEKTTRLHMPGHKGKGPLGFENIDITEIHGADSLYEASGIIARSEKNASDIFACDTFYSTEGSSQCIKAMLYLLCLYAVEKGEKCRLLAARNVHKTFLSAAMSLDFDIDWLYEKDSTYLSCRPSSAELEKKLSEGSYTALYITSPDYIGGVADIAMISRICHKYNTLLVVDGAHGAYLRFLSPSQHPIDLGADLCCTSAHKTLGVLTGGAYLHLSDTLPSLFKENAKRALSFFGSTSPSYLILQSLDLANSYLASDFSEALNDLAEKTDALKAKLIRHGYILYGDEKIKLTIKTRPFGYDGRAFAAVLREKGIEIEFCDPDFAVMMLSVSNTEKDLDSLEKALLSIEKKPAIASADLENKPHIRAMSPRKAMLSPSEVISAENSSGRILADCCVGCPPAVPILMCGEIITEADTEAFRYYGIENCRVVK